MIVNMSFNLFGQLCGVFFMDCVCIDIWYFQIVIVDCLNVDLNGLVDIDQFLFDGFIYKGVMVDLVKIVIGLQVGMGVKLDY